MEFYPGKRRGVRSCLACPSILPWLRAQPPPDPDSEGDKNLGNIGNSPGNPGKPLRSHGDRPKSGGSYGKTRFWHRNLGFSRVFSPLFRPQIHIPRRDFRLLRLQAEFVPCSLVLREKSWNSSPREAGKAGIGGGKANPGAEIHGKSDSRKSSEQKAPPRVKFRRYPKKKSLEKAAPAEPGRNSRQWEGPGRSQNSKSFTAASVEEGLSQKSMILGIFRGNRGGSTGTLRQLIHVGIFSQ